MSCHICITLLQRVECDRLLSVIPVQAMIRHVAFPGWLLGLETLMQIEMPSYTNITPSETLNVDGLVQDYSNSSALAMELLQSYTKPYYSLTQSHRYISKILV